MAPDRNMPSVVNWEIYLKAGAAAQYQRPPFRSSVGVVLRLEAIRLRIGCGRYEVMNDVPLLDYAFLAFESEASPKHVAGLQIFGLPEGATDN